MLRDTGNKLEYRTSNVRVFSVVSVIQQTLINPDYKLLASLDHFLSKLNFTLHKKIFRLYKSSVFQWSRAAIVTTINRPYFSNSEQVWNFSPHCT